MDSTVLLIGLGAVFIGVFGAIAAVALVGDDRRGVARSLAAVEAIKVAPEPMRRELDQPFGERVTGPAFDRLVGWGRRLTPTGRAAAIRHKLDLAGNPVAWDVDRVLAFKMLGLLIGAALGVLLPLLAGNVLLAVLLGIGLAALGFYLPDIVLYQAAYNRSDQMRRELPDALDLLVVSVEAGLGFDAALAQVARNTHGPLADELFRVLQEMQIGTGRSDAMRALGERTDVADLRGFVTSMVQADAFGIPVANVLRVQAREMRIKRSQRAEEAAQKVPVKILFPLIFCIMPALFIVIMGPAVIQIIQSFSNV